jgi:integrase
VKKPKFRLAGFEYDSARGVVHLEVCLPGTRGKERRRRTVQVKDRDGAVEAWRKFREEVGLRGGKARHWTLGAYLAEYETALTARVTPKTAKNRLHQFKILTQLLGSTRLDRINSAIVRDFASAAAAQGYQPPTLNGLLSMLGQVLRDAVERQELAFYPVRGRMPKVREESLRLEMSDEERLRFVAAFDDEDGFRKLYSELRDGKEDNRGRPIPAGEAALVYFDFFRATRPLFVVALETGLSRGDLLALRWQDVATSPIRVKRHKTGVEAVIPISNAYQAALDEAKSQAHTGKDRVFVGPSGRPLCIDTLWRYFQIAKKLAGIDRRLRFHDLRHTFGSRLVSAGVPLAMVAKAMGHKSIRMTERYARVSDDSLRAISTALNELQHEHPAPETRGESKR